ncbi:MAG: DUF362 domain-containing protein [Thermodesulfobacteriota bacterium]|nr:DUF362 domain-containing protein [Thermodesulfobacteriota bacterium]
MNLNSTVVALTSCPEYTQPTLVDTINRVMASLDQIPNLHSCTVLLKPNLITARYGILPCTEPAFMLAVARWFVDQGARVRIGDSPAFGSAGAALQTLGITAELTDLGVRITDFKRYRNVDLAGGGKAGIAVDAMECDLLVNLPRIKAHAQTRVTLAVKNCFGCLAGLRKPWWHMAYGGKGGGFSDRLVQLLDVLANSITLVDGVHAMHKTGPLHGEMYPLTLLGASSNPAAMDRALLKVLDVDPEQSPLMQACRRAGVLGAEFSQLQFPLATPIELQVHDFQVPEQLNPVRFNLFRYAKNTVRRICMR